LRSPNEIFTATKDKAIAIPTQTVIAIKMIAGEFIDLWFAHPKKMTAFIIIELWIHSLSFQHLTELKSLMDLIPFLGK